MTLLLQLPTQSHYEMDGVQTVWPFSFVGGYIDREHVRAYTLSALDVRTDLVLTDANFVTDFQLEITPAGADGETLVIYRDTSNGGLPLVDFIDGTIIDEVSLDIIAKQSVFVAAESADFLGVTTTADLQDLAQAAAASAGAASASASAAASSATSSSTSASSAATSATGAASSASAAATSAANAASAVNTYKAQVADDSNAANGPGLMGFGDQAYADETAGGKLREWRSIKDKGASVAGTGVANLTAVNAAVAASREVRVPEGDYVISAVPTNTLGSEFSGAGRLRLPVSGGSRQVNVTADAGQHVFGTEYLFAFHVAIRSQGPGDTATIVCSGDSTTYGAGGNGATSPFLLSDLMLTLGADAGYRITAINNGRVGANTYQWRTTYLADDMAAVPNLLILRWGINDPGWLKNNTTPPLDSGQDYPNRRDIGDFRDDLRAGLTTIRAARSVKSLSILLMTPNCTNDTPNGRDELWYEQVRLVVRQAARDFQCTFIDTYALWNDTRNGAADESPNDGWMDNLMPAIPGEANRAIHPHNVMNSWIASKIAEVIYPRGIRANYFPGILGLQPAASVPAAFKRGLNLQRTAATGFPEIDGGVATILTPDELGMQVAWDYADPSTRPAIRFGFNTAWFEWLSMQGADPTLGASWVPYDGTGNHNVRVTKSWGRVKISGTIKNGTVTSGTVLFTLPAGFRPIGQQWFPCTTGTSMDTTAHVTVLTDGRVMIQAGVNTNGLCLSSISFEAYA